MPPVQRRRRCDGIIVQTECWSATQGAETGRTGIRNLLPTVDLQTGSAVSALRRQVEAGSDRRAGVGMSTTRTPSLLRILEVPDVLRGRPSTAEPFLELVVGQSMTRPFALDLSQVTFVCPY